MRDETVISGIGHRRVQKPVDNKDTGLFFQFVLDRLAAHRHFDDNVDVFRRVIPDGDCFDTHDSDFR